MHSPTLLIQLALETLSFICSKSLRLAHSSLVIMKFMVFLVFFSWVAAFASNFSQDFDITWGSDRVRLLNDGELLTLSLDKDSGSAFQSKNEYLFGKFSMELKLVPGNSAGTVTSYYLCSEGSTWDEIDFEFLGNLSGEPYTVHTNVITAGKGDREQQFHLWFDPTADFHTYSILWNPHGIIFSVDTTPIRLFKNLDSTKIQFPNKMPMRIRSSIWNADDWATRGGLIKTDWSKAPFTASYRNLSTAQSCIWPASPCDPNDWVAKELDASSLEKLTLVQQHYMIYNYCIDTKRFPQGLPPECAATILI